MKLFWTALILAGFASAAAAQTLDFDTFRSKVEPIFLKKRASHVRCVVCHSSGGNAFLVPLPEGQTSYTEEQSRQNFQKVSKLVNAKNLMASPILKHPLAQAAGGDDFHSGGRQFKTQDDPDWKTIRDWASGASSSAKGGK